MRKAKREDRKLVVDILTRCFMDNPGVNWLFGKKGDHQKKVRRLIRYAFIKSVLRDGVYISSNEKGVALCYAHHKKVFSVTEIRYQLAFALLSIPLSRLPGVLRRESYRNKRRSVTGDYLYFWFFGVLPGGKEAAFELKNAIFNQAAKDNIPILLETTLERNKRIYERYGFTTYHHWLDPNQHIEFWFMRWQP